MCLRNQMARPRRPAALFDATILLIANWKDEAKSALGKVEDADELLSGSRFFGELTRAVLDSTPVDLHEKPRRLLCA